MIQLDEGTLILLYTKVFPMIAIFLSMLIIAFLLFAPKSIKTMMGSWMSRRSGALMLIANDDGFVRFDFCKGDMGQGIFTGKIANYLFTPRPTSINSETNQEEALIDDEQKRFVDNAIQYRCITDFGKPIYLVYLGKSIGVSPQLLKIMEDLKPGSGKKESYIVTGLNARTLKEYIQGCFAPSLIDSLTFQHEKIGWFSRPLDKIKEKVLPIGMIIVILVVIYMFSKGMIPGIGGA